MKKLFYFSIVLLATACSQVPNEEEVKSAINTSNDTFVKHIKEGNADGVAALYTEDCILMAPNMPALSGREGVKGYMQHAIAAGVTLKFTTQEVSAGIDLAVERGQYELFVADSIRVDVGKYMVQWKKNDKGWLMYRDIMNSDAAAPRTVAKSGETVWMINYFVKADKGKDFESFVHEVLIPAIDQSNPRQAQAVAQTRLLAPKKADAKGVLRYVFVMDPVVAEATYGIDEALITKYGEAEGKKKFADFNSLLVKDYEFVSLVQTNL